MLTTTRRRRLMAVLAMPLLIVLAGCGRFTADFEIQDVDTMQLSLDVGIETTWIEGEYASAEEMCADMDSESQDEGVYNQVTFDPYEEDGMWGCRASGTVDRAEFGEDFELTEEDGEFRLVIAGDDATPVTQSDLDMIGASDFEFRMSFAFPGEIIESSGGQVDGSTVVFTDIGELNQGVDIRAEAGGFPWVIVVVVVLVVGFFLLVALAVVGFLIYRSRKGGSSGPGGPGAPAAAGAAGAAGATGAMQPPPAPQGDQGQQWGQTSPPPPAPQGDQWGQPGQQDPQAQPWDRPQPGQQGPHGPQSGNQPPQGPGW